MEVRVTRTKSDELYHHGIKGQKWGVRRYQNADGSLTEAGRKRLYKDANSAAKKGNGHDFEVKYEKHLREGVDSVKDSIRRGDSYNKYNKIGTEYAAKLLQKYGDKPIGDYKNWTAKNWVNSAIWRIAKNELDAESKKRSPEQIAKLDKTYNTFSKEDKQTVDDFTKKAAWDKWGSYNSTMKTKVDNTDSVTVEISTKEGSEKYDSTETVSFLKRFNNNKAVEGIAKEYYDGPHSWIDKEPGEDNYYSRDDFKSKVKLSRLDINPEDKTYVAEYDDGGTYGYHSFIVEGSMVDMKAKYRSLWG